MQDSHKKQVVKMIPKMIHYCWFGKNEYPDIMKKCLKSWCKFCPDYKLMLWNENTFYVNSTEWTKQAYEAEKYAFVADYVRLKVIHEYGGIYLDIDQELIKPLDQFLSHSAFLGFMREDSVNTGIIGAEPNHPVISKLFHYYDNRPFIIDGKQDLLPNTDWVSEQLVKEGLILNDSFQTINNGVVVYPREYFCPIYCTQPYNLKSSNTVSIHHWAMTWRTEEEKLSFEKLKKSRRKSVIIAKRIKHLPYQVYKKLKRTIN